MANDIWMELLKYLFAAFAIPAIYSFYSVIKSLISPAEGQEGSQLRGFSLQISQSANATAITNSGRVPLELHPRSRNAVSFPIYLAYRIFLDIPYTICLRPSSRKNAFVVSNVKIYRASELFASGGRLLPGGLRVVVWLHENEDRQHFCRSLRQILIKRLCQVDSRHIAVVSSGFFDGEDTKIRLIRVAVDKESLRKEGTKKVILRSRRTSHGHSEEIRYVEKNDIPPNTIWMVETLQDTAFPIQTNREVKKQKKSDKDRGRVIDAIYSVPPLSSDQPRLRLLRHFLIIYLGASVVITFGSETDWNFDFSSLPTLEKFLIVFQIAVFTIVLVSHLVRYLMFERGKRSWAGGTTGCLEDGSFLRNG